MKFRRVCIIGVGLLGGSIGMALKSRGMAGEVVGTGRSRLRLKNAVALGAIDSMTQDSAEAANNADLVIACTPVQQIVESLVGASLVAAPDAILTDVEAPRERSLQGLNRP